MGVTNVTINGLSVHDGVNYATGADTLTMLEAMSPYEAIMVDMANRHPVFVRSQIQARPITLVVYMLKPNALDRHTDFVALRNALNPAGGLVTLTWVDTTGPAPTQSLEVICVSLVPSNWMHRCSAELIAPNPEPSV